MPGSVLAAVANPLPKALSAGHGGSIDQLTQTYETLWPFRVVPTSFVGEAYACGGLLLVAFLFLITGFLIDWVQSRFRSPALRRMGLALGLVVFVGAIQYSFRQLARVDEILVVYALLRALGPSLEGSTKPAHRHGTTATRVLA